MSGQYLTVWRMNKQDDWKFIWDGGSADPRKHEVRGARAQLVRASLYRPAIIFDFSFTLYLNAKTKSAADKPPTPSQT
jgi:hypothetical protein